MSDQPERSSSRLGSEEPQLAPSNGVAGLFGPASSAAGRSRFAQSYDSSASTSPKPSYDSAAQGPFNEQSALMQVLSGVADMQKEVSISGDANESSSSSTQTSDDRN